MGNSRTRCVFKDTVKHLHTYIPILEERFVSSVWDGEVRGQAIPRHVKEARQLLRVGMHKVSIRREVPADGTVQSTYLGMDSRAFPASIFILDFSFTITYYNCLFSLFVDNFEILKLASIITFLTQCNFKSLPRPHLVTLIRYLCQFQWVCLDLSMMFAFTISTMAAGYARYIRPHCLPWIVYGFRTF